MEKRMIHFVLIIIRLFGEELINIEYNIIAN
ncbi:MAG: Uncharacterised protein [Flavobacterium sp. SCGC AAA160-P02]|nr:MAG: Uncharacterised protein [Flavobacterium sp. SCGC AAA160-P02]